MTGPPVAVAACRHAVRTALAHRSGLVLVACSGGADSLALAAATAFVAPKLSLPAGAIVVDHGLQPGSAQVAEAAAAQCRDLGLDPVLIRTVTVSAGGGPEAAARTARYAAFDDAAAETGARTVLLGHTLDDQAETVLLALSRGSGTRAVAGMPPTRDRYVRPFLGLRRSDTEAACAALGLTWWDDPTNAPGPDAPLRSQLRAVLPGIADALGPGFVAGLARTADQARDDADLLDDLAQQLYARARRDDDGAVALDATTLRAAAPALRTRAIRLALLAAGAPAGALTAAHVAAVRQLVDNPRGRGPAHVAGDVRARVVCGRLVAWPATGRSTGVDAHDVGDEIERVVLTPDAIQARLAEMAAEIDADYAGKDLLLVGVLKGAVMVMADLARALHNRLEMDWMAVSSYGAGTTSSGVVRILKDLDTDITGRNVLIVEDIIDSGLTLSWLVANLRSRGAASVEVATLMRKPKAAKVAVDTKYVGFDIPSDFVVGYGLDYAEKYRNLPFVAVLAKQVYTH